MNCRETIWTSKEQGEEGLCICPTDSLEGMLFSVGKLMLQSMVYFLVTFGVFFAVLANCKLDQL